MTAKVWISVRIRGDSPIREYRGGIAMRFTDPVVRTSVEVDAALMDNIHEQILTIERQITARVLWSVFQGSQLCLDALRFL